MQDVLNTLTGKIEKAVSEIARLKSEQEAVVSEKNSLLAKVAELEERIRGIENEKNVISGDFNSKIAKFSEMVEDAIKKLDKVI